MCIRMTNKIARNKYIFSTVGFSPDFLMRLKVLHEAMADAEFRKRQCKLFLRDKVSNIRHLDC